MREGFRRIFVVAGAFGALAAFALTAFPLPAQLEWRGPLSTDSDLDGYRIQDANPFTTTPDYSRVVVHRVGPSAVLVPMEVSIDAAEKIIEQADLSSAFGSVYLFRPHWRLDAAWAIARGLLAALVASLVVAGTWRVLAWVGEGFIRPPRSRG